MDTVGTVKIEFWAVVLGATDAILNLEMPYGYELKRLKLKDIDGLMVLFRFLKNTGENLNHLQKDYHLDKKVNLLLVGFSG